MTPSRTLEIAVAACFAATPALAHHSMAIYDETSTVTVDGTIREFRFANPHAQATLDVVGSDGVSRQWTVEFEGRFALAVFGWTEATLKPGERVLVSGNPERTGEPRMFFARIVRADGAQIVRGGNQLNAAKEKRRLRAAQKAAAAEK
jgi:hypothetical protein